MRRFFVLLTLTVSPLYGLAGPAKSTSTSVSSQGSEVLVEEVRVAQSPDQRRAALRQALVPQQDPASDRPDATPVRQLSPSERAELRRQLRDQSKP